MEKKEKNKMTKKEIKDAYDKINNTKNIISWDEDIDDFFESDNDQVTDYYKKQIGEIL